MYEQSRRVMDIWGMAYFANAYNQPCETSTGIATVSRLIALICWFILTRPFLLSNAVLLHTGSGSPIIVKFNTPEERGRIEGWNVHYLLP